MTYDIRIGLLCVETNAKLCFLTSTKYKLFQ